MGNWKFSSLLKWPRLQPNKRTISADKATSSATESADQGLNGTRCRRAKNRIRSLVSRTLQSTRTLFRIGRRAPPVSDVPSDASRNNAEIFTISYYTNEYSSSSGRQRPNYSSSVHTTETELNAERTTANFETTREQSPVQQTLDSRKLPQTPLNSRTSFFSIGKSTILNIVKNKYSTPSASSSTLNSNKFASSSTKRNSKLLFFPSPIKTPTRSYSQVHSSTLISASGASGASPCTAAGSDFSPISSDQSLSAHRSVNFEFNSEHPESKDLLTFESPVASSTQVYNRTAVSPTENEDRQSLDLMTSVGENFTMESSVSRRRSLLAEHLNNIVSRRIYRPTRTGQPDGFFSSDGHSLTFEAFCKSQFRTPEVTSSNLPIRRNGDRPPALPPKFRKFLSSCTPMQFPKACLDGTYVQPKRPSSFPTLSRTEKQMNETVFTPDNDYYEIIELFDARLPLRSSPRQPNTNNTGHQILDVPRTHENSPPPPLPPRCPRRALPSGMPLRNCNAEITSQVDCPQPLPPRIPTVRPSETVNIATRLTLRGIAAIALASSLEDISRQTQSLSTSVATQTCPEGRTVATQTNSNTVSTQTAFHPISDAAPSVSDGTVIHPEDYDESEIYISMNGGYKLYTLHTFQEHSCSEVL